MVPGVVDTGRGVRGPPAGPLRRRGAHRTALDHRRPFRARFVNEAANYNDMQKAFFSFDANEYSSRHLPCWVVFDSQYRSRYAAATVRPGDPDPDWLPVHETLEGLGSARWGSTRWAWPRPSSGGTASVRDGQRPRTSAVAPVPTTGSTATPPRPTPTWAPSNEGPFYALPIHVGSVGTKGGPGSTAMDGSSTCTTVPSLVCTGPGNVIASPAGPAYYGGGTSIGMALVWGHLAGSHAASYAIAGDPAR